VGEGKARAMGLEFLFAKEAREAGGGGRQKRERHLTFLRRSWREIEFANVGR